MSIIHDALKKAQTNIQIQQTPKPAKAPAPSNPVAAPANPVEPAAKDSSAASLGKYALIILAVICLIVVAQTVTMMVLSSSPSKTASESPKTTAPSTAGAPAHNPPAANSVPLASPASLNNSTPAEVVALSPAIEMTQPVNVKPQLVLNGISNDGVRPLALINNEIYETGDTIYGMTVTGISATGVELQDGDQKIFLKKR